MRRFLKVLVACFCTLVFAGGCEDIPEYDSDLQGYWVGQMNTGTGDIPFRFVLTDTSLILVNGEEKVLLTKKSATGDTLRWAFPHYSGEMAIHGLQKDSLWGAWNNSSLPNNQFTFHAIAAPKPSDDLVSTEYSSFYNVFFNNGVKAFGTFNFSDSISTGTFLTETGDYRFLQGQMDNGNFWLSTFDGDHLYLAEGTLRDSGIVTGKFFSRNKEPIPWTGIESAKNHLGHPDSLTTLTASRDQFEFSVLNFQGERVIFDATDFHDNVTIVSLFGSWCPNCHDELRFHRDLLNELDHTNLQFIPVAFERDKNITEANKAVKRVFKAFDILSEPYYGGTASKSEAVKVFPMLDQVRAFPTTIVIDKNGKVRKIHTGFSGPGTGSFYENHKTETTSLLRELLRE